MLVPCIRSGLSHLDNTKVAAYGVLAFLAQEHSLSQLQQHAVYIDWVFHVSHSVENIVLASSRSMSCTTFCTRSLISSHSCAGGKWGGESKWSEEDQISRLPLQLLCHTGSEFSCIVVPPQRERKVGDGSFAMYRCHAPCPACASGACTYPSTTLCSDRASLLVRPEKHRTVGTSPACRGITCFDHQSGRTKYPSSWKRRRCCGGIQHDTRSREEKRHATATRISEAPSTGFCTCDKPLL